MMRDTILLASLSEQIKREALNDAKSNVECIERVVCAARDHIDGKEIDDMRVRKFLLSLDVSPFTSSGALPGFTSVYRGMPVILRHHNPCPPLGIANGSQGSVADFAIDINNNGLNILKWSLVHFPQSDVNLPDLPVKHVLLTPIDYSFTTKIPGILTENDEPKRVRVKRQQADYQ
jgi:hypothetical protein